MARPKKAIVDYFPHYVNHGKTMFTVESKYGNDGYAFWFKLLELLGSTEQHFIDCRDQDTWQYLLAKTRINEVTANEILDLLSRIGAVDNELWEHRIIWSSNFIDNLSSVYSRREVNVFTKDNIKGFLHTENPLTGVIDNINPQSRVKDSRVKDSRVKDSRVKDSIIKRRKFIPPTLDQVKIFFAENEYSEQSAITAFNHYDLANWHDSNGKPVLNWKQKMNTIWFKPENKIPMKDVVKLMMP